MLVEIGFNGRRDEVRHSWAGIGRRDSTMALSVQDNNSDA